MSVKFQDISKPLIDGMFTVLNTHVIYQGVSYPVYKTRPNTLSNNYVYIGGVQQAENGTKDDFHYNGTVQVQVVCANPHRADKELAQSILNVVRGLLKPTKSSVFSLSGLTLVVFSHESMTEILENENGETTRVNLADLYTFLID